MSKMNRSQFLRWGMSALPPAILVACGGPAPETQKPVSATAEPAKPVARNVSLVVSNNWTAGDRLTIVKAWLERANKVYPNIKTELNDNANSQEKLIAQFAADQQGDLVQVDQHVIPVFGPKNLLEDISPTLATLKFDLTSIFDIDTITMWKGKRHGLLIQLNSNVWVYNKDLFQKNGVTEPTATWTWNDHVEAAHRLTRAADNQWGMNVRADLYPWYWQAGVEYLTADGLKTNFDSAGSKQVLNHLVDIVTKSRAAPSNAEAVAKPPSFANGNFATTVTSSPGLPLTKQIDGRFVWEIMPTPKHPSSGKVPGLVVTGHNYAITRKATQRGNLLESAQILLELYNKDIQQLYNNGSLAPGSTPILKAVATSAEALKPPPVNAKVVVDQIPTGRNYDKIVGFLDMHAVLGPEFYKAIDATISANEAADNMKRLADAALANAAR